MKIRFLIVFLLLICFWHINVKAGEIPENFVETNNVSEQGVVDSPGDTSENDDYVHKKQDGYIPDASPHEEGNNSEGNSESNDTNDGAVTVYNAPKILENNQDNIGENNDKNEEIIDQTTGGEGVSLAASPQASNDLDELNNDDTNEPVILRGTSSYNYELQSGKSVNLTDILTSLGIDDTITSAAISDEDTSICWRFIQRNQILKKLWSKSLR